MNDRDKLVKTYYEWPNRLSHSEKIVALLHHDEYWLRNWIDNVVVEQGSVEAADKLDDVINDAEDRYGVEIDYMSKLQLLSVIAEMMEILGI